jgi:magnesium transporter
MMDHGDLRDRDRLSSSSGFDSHSRLLSERDRLDRDRDRGLVERGLARSNFDFKAMDDYAEQERNAAIGGGQSAPKWILSGDEGLKRRSRGQSAAGQPGSYSTTFDRTNTMSQYGDDNAADPGSTHRASLENESDRPHDELGGEHSNEGDQPFSPKESVASTTFHRRRQRKLSQSNPVMRRQGKLALFEGFGSLGSANEGSLETPAGFKAPRHPKNLGPASGQPFVPFTDAAPGHDRPYRFSFYSNALPVTIHARSLAELPAEGQTFEDLFKGKNGEGTGESSGDVSNGAVGTGSGTETPVDGMAGQSVNGKMSLLARAAGVAASQHTGNSAQKGAAGVPPSGPPGNADDDPEAFTWWLDVLSPTDEEMRMLSKVFGIHPLTTEDILLEETREKIELFRNYYLVCFRSFDQDPYSQTYLEPLNMYIIVFREGTLSVSCPCSRCCSGATRVRR